LRADFARVRFLITGRVQGVYFRGSTAAEARRLGISGSAVNLDDGRVEVLAFGRQTDIDELAAWLQHGPRLAQVVSIQTIVEDASAGAVPDGFRTG